MVTFKCKMCGGDIHAQIGDDFGTCDSCQSTSTLPKANDERIVNLFNRANHFRRLNEFDKALATYENILNEDSTNAEAHWGVVLCRYGIEYIEDPVTRKRVPTCHRVQYTSVLADPDYLATLENTPDSYTKSIYEQEAQAISEIQKGILAIAANEEPFDVFICYKESTDGGSRTKDSTLAQDIYYQLTNDGFKVFFAKITLEGKLGRQYEPYIFNALNTAKVMLVIGTKAEYFNAVWVKNEWSRFLSLMKDDRSRLLIPCYRDMDPYDMPEELSRFQSLDMGKIGFAQDLIRGVKKMLEVPEVAPTLTTSNVFTSPGVDSLMKRGWLFLEDKDWKQAEEYFDKVLDIAPEHAPAYIGKLCAQEKVAHESDLPFGENKKLVTFTNNSNYSKALRFADAAYRAKLEGYNKILADYLAKEEAKRRKQAEKERIEQAKREAEERYNQMLANREECITELDEMFSYTTKDNYELELESIKPRHTSQFKEKIAKLRKDANTFASMPDFKNSSIQAKKNKELAEAYEQKLPQFEQRMAEYEAYAAVLAEEYAEEKRLEKEYKEKNRKRIKMEEKGVPLFVGISFVLAAILLFVTISVNGFWWGIFLTVVSIVLVELIGWIVGSIIGWILKQIGIFKSTDGPVLFASILRCALYVFVIIVQWLA
ncbi:MAG: TIR domain-containing protein [Defluviitaleaceae bacterium]|nr:TIR domain-containing protein [Defluviitaleaceae bacterium]